MNRETEGESEGSEGKNMVVVDMESGKGNMMIAVRFFILPMQNSRDFRIFAFDINLKRQEEDL